MNVSNPTCACEPSANVAERGDNLREDLYKIAERLYELKHRLRNAERAITGESMEEKVPIMANNGKEPCIGQTIDAIFREIRACEAKLDNICQGVWG
jgi:histone deacetylase complex regulatory component SIN3